MSEDDRNLVSGEGVDEGSKDSAIEAAGDDNAAALLGEPAAGEPANSEQQAAPELIGTGTGEPAGPGQRQQVGEG